MKLLLVHNCYQEPGGEDAVVEAERNLLIAAGHRVVDYVRHNGEIRRYGALKKATLPLRTVWAWDSFHDIKALLQKEKPDVAHFHNIFPLISPAAYYACQEANVPVVQSLHNPRLLCPAATLYRNGGPCEKCIATTIPWPAVVHACYRQSGPQSAVVASMLTIHHWLKTWESKVRLYVVFSDFYRDEFTKGGLPVSKIVVKPHFVPADPGVRQGKGAYALFIGRLAPEKGVRILLDAWKQLKHIPLKIRGEGSLTDEVRDAMRAEDSPVALLPRVAASELPCMMQGARFLVWPSVGYYETFGRVVIESFACGVPVICSRLGAMQEIVADGRTGLHFTPGDSADLARKAEWAWTHPEEMATMGRAARAQYEAKYTAERNYPMLVNIYHRALEAGG